MNIFQKLINGFLIFALIAYTPMHSMEHNSGNETKKSQIVVESVQSVFNACDGADFFDSQKIIQFIEKKFSELEQSPEYQEPVKLTDDDRQMILRAKNELARVKISFVKQTIKSLIDEFVSKHLSTINNNEFRNIISRISEIFIKEINFDDYLITKIHESKMRNLLIKDCLADNNFQHAKDKPTMLHTAIEFEFNDWVRQNLRKYGNELNKIDHLGLTPLMMAIKKQNFEIIQMLIAADTILQNNENQNGVYLL